MNRERHPIEEVTRDLAETRLFLDETRKIIETGRNTLPVKGRVKTKNGPVITYRAGRGKMPVKES